MLLFYFLHLLKHLSKIPYDGRLRGVRVMNNKKLTINDYDKISDDLCKLGPNVIVRFNTTLARKDDNGTRIPFHTEYEYKSSKYTDKKILRTLRRSYDYYLSIENIKQPEYVDKEFISIKTDDMLILRHKLKIALMWFFDSKYKNLYMRKSNNKLVLSSIAENIIIYIREKYIEIEPVILEYNGIQYKGVRIYINSKDNYTDVLAEKFIGFIYIIDNLNMIELSQNQLNYMQRPELGYNTVSFLKTQEEENEEDQIEEVKSTRKIPRSFFDKMDTL